MTLDPGGNIAQKILTAVESVTFRPVKSDEPLLSTQAIDSIGLVDLVVLLEKQLNVHLDMAVLSQENFNTVEDMVRYVEELQG